MRIDSQKIGDVVVVTLREPRLDAKVAVAFRQRLAEITTGVSQRLALDMSEVEFVDSSGLGALVSLMKAVHPNGALALCGLSASPAALFKLTRMDKVFRIYASADEACAALSAGTGGGG